MVTDEAAWEMAERLNAAAPDGVRYEIRRTEKPLRPPQAHPPQLQLGENAEPVTPWYVARVKSEA